ncbi:MAG: carboxypeptidase-like regulatory domain-containing protein, partial [Bryobacteraceae bacterium]
PTQTAPTYGLIAGTVLDGGAKTPLRKANVTLTMLGAKLMDALAWTDDSGHFAFGYLPPGRYQVRADFQGFQNALHAKPNIVVLQAGETRSDLVIPLFRLGAISGTVLDDDGEPAEGAMVAAQPAWLTRAKNSWGGPMASTDSHGHYRISNLQAGKYNVVLEQNNRTTTHEGSEVSAAAPPPRQYVYLRQFYPGTENPAAAAVLTIESGKELSGIDFRGVSRPAVTIQGHVIPPPNIAGLMDGAQVMLSQPVSRFGFAGGTSANLPDFAFFIPNATPGPHILVAQAVVGEKQYRGVQHIDIGENNPEINIPLEPGVTISGTVTVTGRDAANHTASFVSLVPGDDVPWNGPPFRATVNPDGTYKIPSVPPGIWDIEAGPVPKGGYMKSMLLGDQDVLTEEMRITSSTAAPLNIVIATNGASLEGQVTNAAGDPVQAPVVLMPAGRFQDVVSFRRRAFSNEKGRYRMLGLMPGAYKLYALEDFDLRSEEDIEGLKPLAKSAVAVELKEGEKTSQDLKLIVRPAGGN